MSPEPSPPSLRRICCLGSGRARTPHQIEIAETAGARIAAAGHGLVYGGGRYGVMGALAEGYLRVGGPELTAVNLAYYETRGRTGVGAHKTQVVVSRRARVDTFLRLSEHILVFPGGIGTLEELFVLLADRQMEEAPGLDLWLVNIDGFFDPIIAWLDQALAQGLCDVSDRVLRVAANLGDIPWLQQREQIHG